MILPMPRTCDMAMFIINHEEYYYNDIYARYVRLTQGRNGP